MSKLLAAKQTDLDVLVQFILKNDIVLTTDQEELSQRLIFVDEKIRSRKFDRDEIINMTKTRFGVSKWRAEQDITDTHTLFGKTRKISKPYVLAHHIEDIQKQIQTALSRGRLELLPKLNDNLTYALNSLPEEGKAIALQPLKLVFINNNEKTPQLQKTLAELIAEADTLLSNDTDDEYIPFEEDEGEGHS